MGSVKKKLWPRGPFEPLGPIRDLWGPIRGSLKPLGPIWALWGPFWHHILDHSPFVADFGIPWRPLRPILAPCFALLSKTLRDHRPPPRFGQPCRDCLRFGFVVWYACLRFGYFVWYVCLRFGFLLWCVCLRFWFFVWCVCLRFELVV